ncbi:hypothetical protein OG352_13390 [Streptomyces sp. NBC_01485]|uniref:solute carrier family 23 protein n=1 Tax=Streptomyces sp. NBC_01485 TaxID=2903884 RepID=UPI002E31C404|nr:solute carrier family 23 protein [Streptomyces sp. NBC_01485]
MVFGAAARLDTSTIGLLINAELLVAGLVTLLQALGMGKVLGERLPVVAGATFSAVTPMILIAGEYGMQAVCGCKAGWDMAAQTCLIFTHQTTREAVSMSPHSPAKINRWSAQ